MSEKKSLFAQVKDASQAVVAAAAVAGLLGGFAVKAWGWAQAGPVALSKATKLEKRTRRLELQSRFVVKVLEKKFGTPYDWAREERELTRVEDNE